MWKQTRKVRERKREIKKKSYSSPGLEDENTRTSTLLVRREVDGGEREKADGAKKEKLMEWKDERGGVRPFI